MNMNLTQQTGNNRSKRIPVFAAGIALALCLAAVVAARFKTYDPSVPAESETILDYCLFAGVWLVPFASVCFAKRLFEGRRFRFALSWLVGFLIPGCCLFMKRISRRPRRKEAIAQRQSSVLDSPS